MYEIVEHPAAKALTGYLLVRGGVHQVAYARALENLTGSQLQKLFRRPASRPRRSPSASRTSSAATTSASTASRRTTTRRSSPSSTASTRRPATSSRWSTGRRKAQRRTTCSPSPGRSSDYHPEEIAEIAAKLRTAAGLPKELSGEVNVPASAEGGMVDKLKDAIT